MEIKEMIQGGWKRYGVLSKHRRYIGLTLMSMSLILPDLGLGLIIGMLVMKIDPRLKLKTLKYDLIERWRLI